MAQSALVNMPFASLRWPALGPGLLQAALRERGVECRQFHFQFDFAEAIGPADYQWLAESFAFVAGGERLFARCYYPDLPDDESYFREVLTATDPGFSRAEYGDFLRAGAAVIPFLDRCAASVDWGQFAAVGFSVSYQQTLASLCLARRLKRRFPSLKILFGGAACAGEMGEELLRSYPEVDYVFLGEGERSLPDLVEQLIAGAAVRLPPGVIGRVANFRPAPCDAVDLNSLPLPDFDDYFAQLHRSPLHADVAPSLAFETSRGCWWGQRRHCAFCGLNGQQIGYRSKAPERVVDELRRQIDRYGLLPGTTCDNVLDFRSFDRLLPLLEQADLGFRFVIELRTTLSRRQVAQLLAAGLGAAQLGIETFSTPILHQINKGATAVQNLQTLKWFTEAGIEVKWNFLYGFPLEDPAEYTALADLLPSLVHLAPPTAVGRVRADRFSPYFQEPAAHGIVNLRPHNAYRFIYSLPPEATARLAYYYQYDYADSRNVSDYVGAALDAVQQWSALAGQTTLRQWDRPDGALLLTDTRPCAAVFQQRLTGWEREVYLYCDTGRSLAAIQRRLHTATANPPDRAALVNVLERWRRERLLAFLDGRYLSLALRAASDV